MCADTPEMTIYLGNTTFLICTKIKKNSVLFYIGKIRHCFQNKLRT